MGIPFFNEVNGMPIKLDDVESIIKTIYVFNNIALMSKPYVIKASPKSNMAIVQINIWNAQRRANAKHLIKRLFNIGKYITTVEETSINPGISQYKTAGDSNTLHLHIILTVLSALSAMGHINLSIIGTWHNTTNQTLRSILQDWKC